MANRVAVITPWPIAPAAVLLFMASLAHGQGANPAQDTSDFEMLSNEAVVEPFLMVPSPDAELGEISADGLRVIPSPSVAQPVLVLPQTMATELEKSQGASSEAEALSSPSQSETTSYDPSTFLEAMVDLHVVSRTCETVLPGSPMDEVNVFGAFFQEIGVELPTGIRASLSRTVNLLVRAQAASICQERVNDAVLEYQNQARIFESSKPDAWPAAPIIKGRSWCRTSTCSELR